MVCSIGELHLKGNATFIEDWQDLKVRISKFSDIVLLLQLCNLVCFDSVAWFMLTCTCVDPKAASTNARL